MDLAKIVDERLRKLGWSRADLVRKLARKVSRNAIYGFFGGRGIRHQSLELILEAVGLEVSPADRPVKAEQVQADAIVETANRIYEEVTKRLNGSGSLSLTNEPKRYSAEYGEFLRIHRAAAAQICHFLNHALKETIRREVREEIRRRRVQGMPTLPEGD